MADARKYTDAEVRAILDRALTKSATSDAMSHEELLSIGEQVGVSRDALARAAQDLQDEQLQRAAKLAATSRRWRFLGYHAALFALVNGLAFAVNFLTTPGEWWSLFSIVPWFFVLVLHAGLNAAIPVRAAEARRPARLRVGESTPAAVHSVDAEEEAAPEAVTSARPGNQLR